MARTTGLLYGTGALLVLFTVIHSHLSMRYADVYLVLALVALVVALLVLAIGRWLPIWVYHLLVITGAGLVTLAIYLGEGGSASLAFGCMDYFIAVDAFFFFAWPLAAAHLALAELGAGLAFHSVQMPVQDVLIEQGCCIAVGLVVGWLARAAAAVEVDPLTGLVNRRGFDRLVREAIASAQRSGVPLSLVLLDLDNFKAVNDRGGHADGDRVLRNAARAWGAILRPNQVLARLGGDEFAFVLPECPADRASVLADQLRAAVLADATCSAGVAQWQPHDSQAMLVGRADVALYQAKSQGRDQTAQYGLAEREESRQLLQALTSGEFVVYYQPIIDLGSGAEIGDEALIRWQHPSRGLVPPDTFIAVAERTGAITQIGAWVLEQACAHTAARPGSRRISVNASGRELRSPDYADSVAAILRQTGLAATSLVIEVTESTLDADSPDVIAMLHRLRSFGVRIAIDDFGTGYSTLHRLDHLPADLLKIDRSFISAIPAHGQAPILRAILALADALQMQVVAEGVETELQARVLTQLGCRYAQGYFYGRPRPAADLAQPGPTHWNGAAGEAQESARRG